MMIGEFEFGGVFLDEESDPFESAVFLPEVSYIIFVLFLIVMTILIMNLLVSIHARYLRTPLSLAS